MIVVTINGYFSRLASIRTLYLSCPSSVHEGVRFDAAIWGADSF